MNGQEIEEKKLALNWLGYHLSGNLIFTKVNKPFEHNEFLCKIENWNPGDNDKATFKEWEEIHKNMGIVEMNKILGTFKAEREKTHIPYCNEALYLTASPEIRWKALIQMIKEGK